jgi:hypothetical protein
MLGFDKTVALLNFPASFPTETAFQLNNRLLDTCFSSNLVSSKKGWSESE